MGEVKLNSALNEPLDAEIPLAGVGEITEEEIIVGLASQSDFDQAAVERDFFLVDLHFKVDLADPARAVIRVTSRKAVKEPFLDFLVNLRWPSGRLLREYTLLLDPPVFAAKKPAQMPRARNSSATAERSQTPTRTNGSSGVSEGDYTVARGDTLWEIAQRVGSADATVEQTMVAIQEMNPDAFIGGNINLLISGRVLRLPGAADTNPIDHRRAAARVATQTRSWREATPASAPPLDDRSRDASTTDVTATTDATVADVDGQLHLSASAPRGTESGSAGAGNTTQLAVVREELDRISRENQELKEKLANLEEQVRTSSRLAEIASDPLRAAQVAAVAKTAAAGTEVSQTDSTNASAPTATTALAEPTAAPTDAAPTAAVATAAEPPTPPADQSPPAGEPVYQPSTPQPGGPASEFVAAPEPPVVKEGGIFAILNQYLVVIFGVVAALVVTVIALAMRNRGAASEVVEKELPRFRVPEPIQRPTERPVAQSAAPRSPPSPEDIELDDDDKIFASAGSGDPSGREFVESAGLAPVEDMVQGENPESRLAALSDEITFATSAKTSFDQDLELEWPLDASDAAPASPVETVVSTRTDDEAFELDLDSFDLDAADSLVEFNEAPAPSAGDFGDVAGLEVDAADSAFKLTLEDQLESLGAELKAGAEVDLDESFDLDKDFNLGKDFDLDKEFDLGKDFDFGNDQDAMATQLELAQAYADMDDVEGAREILADVIVKGNAEQQEKARQLLQAIA
ncbi:MAG: FimV/HubP family polar landmark protein [Porticoccaceae bacterium]